MIAIMILLTLSVHSGTTIAEPTEEERKRGLSWASVASRARNNCHKNFNVFSAMKDEPIPK